MTGVKNRNDYYHDYYEQHREKLSEKRKTRYETDPEYRDRAKESARLRRQAAKAEREKLRAEGKLPPAHRRKRKPASVLLNGTNVPAYTLSAVAEKVGRSVHTLNYWVRAGMMPQTPLHSPRGDRLYTDAMILVLKMAVMKRGEVFGRDDLFRSEIEEGWRNLGVAI